MTKFEMEYDENVIIPGSMGINLPFTVSTPPVQSNSESTFALNDTRKDLIEDIRLKVLELSVVSPTNGDFQFLESIELYISAENLNEIRIAYIEDIPSNIGGFISMTTENVNIKDYITKDNFTLRVSTTKDEVETEDYEVKIHSVFLVDAEVLGQ